MENMEKLLEYLKRIGQIEYILSILKWEMDTIAPKKSVEYLIDVSTKYELEIFMKADMEFMSRIWINPLKNLRLMICTKLHYTKVNLDFMRIYWAEIRIFGYQYLMK